MLARNRILVAAAAALVLLSFVPGCNSNIDSADGPDVVMLVENLTIPPVTGAIDATTGTCRLTVTNSTATFKNKPKNEQATTSPFNDIILQDVTVAYDWSGTLEGPSVFGVGGSVPANSSSTANFAVADVADILNHTGQTAALTLTFRGQTVSGDTVSVTTGGSLVVNSCQ